MAAAAPGCRHVHIGGLTGETVALTARLLRSTPLAILGSSVFHAPIDARRAPYRHLTELASCGEVTIDVTAVPLDDIAEAWARQRRGPVGKLVIVPR